MSSKKGGAASSTSQTSLLKLTIPAGGATPSPPVGPALGQKGVKAIDFCRQFNEASKMYQPNTPLRCQISVKPDRTFTFTVRPPATTWLLKRAAGIEKASSERTVARLSGKHLYEIARIKAKDPRVAHMPLQLVFRMLLATARTCGFVIF